MSGALQAVFMNLRSFGTPYFFGRIGNVNGENIVSNDNFAINSSDNIIYACDQSLRDTSGNVITQNSALFSINPDKTIQFKKSYTLSGVTISFFGTATDSLNNIYAIGQHHVSFAVFRAIIVKFNSFGEFVWARTLGSDTSSIFANYISTDSNGDIYVGGYAQNNRSTDRNNFYIAKYNTSGTLQWQRMLGNSTGNTILSDFTVDPSGNSYIGGYSLQSGTGFGFFAKFNSSGNLVWQRQFFGTAFSNVGAINFDSSSNVYISGFSGGGVQNVIKLNSSGNLIWQRTFNKGISSGIAVDSDNNVYVCGDDSSRGQIVKYNSSGTIQWQRDTDATGLLSDNQKHWNCIKINSNDDLALGGVTSRVGGVLNNQLIMIGLFPNNGLFLGTYTFGSVVYTVSQGTGTDSAGSLTINNGGNSIISTALPSNNVTLTESVNTTSITLVDV